MGPYSHFVIATKLAKYLLPEDLGAYYWGSIIPDIRYLAKMRRADTHVERERLQEWVRCYPHLQSFLLGYQVHCLVDEIDVTRRVSAAFPLNILSRMLHKGFAQPQVTMLVEMYYLKQAVPGVNLSGSHNEVLRGLGITPEQTGVVFQSMREYIHAHSFDAALSTFQKIGIIENTRLEKYLNAYQSMQRSRLMNAILLASVKNVGLGAYAIRYVRAGIQANTGRDA